MKYPWVLQIGIGTKVQEFFVFSQVVYVVVLTRARGPISSRDIGFTWQVIVHLKAAINSTIYNHKVINLTTICGVYGLKTAKNSPKPKICVFRQFSSKNCCKIVTEGLIDINLVAKESSH
jgi:hypothetical protein